MIYAIKHGVPRINIIDDWDVSTSKKIAQNRGLKHHKLQFGEPQNLASSVVLGVVHSI